VILFQLSAAFLTGAAAAALGLGPWWPLPALAGVGISLGSYLGGRRGRALLVATAVLALLAGIERFEEARPPSQSGGIALLNGAPGPVHLRGEVVSQPQETVGAQRFEFDVGAYFDGEVWVPTHGKLLVTTRFFPRFAYGEVLELEAVLEAPPAVAGFDYAEYLANRGIVSVTAFPRAQRLDGGGGKLPARLLIEAREPLSDALKRSLPEPESALARGILLGQRASIPRSLSDDLNAAGISHLIAISGYNVTLVAGIVVASLAGLLGVRPATAIAIVAVLVYAAFVGGSPSVLRAAAMGVVMLGARLAGRPGSALGAVVFAGAVLAAWQPLIVDEVAFQLSFAATLGIVLLAGRLRDLIVPIFEGLRLPFAAWLAENVAVTASATAAVLPVTALTFDRVSLVAIPANVLVAPAFLFALAGSFLVALAGAVDAAAGRLLSELAYVPLAYFVAVGRLAADLPFATTSLGPFSVAAPVIVYGGAAAALRFLRPAQPDAASAPVRRVSAALAWSCAVILIAAFVWWQALAPSDGRLRVTFLDIGQGDALLIESPSGHRILVDGGPSGPALAAALGRALPPDARRLDLLVLTHPQDDHTTGLVEALQRYDVGAAMEGPSPGGSAAYRAWRAELARRGVPVALAVPGSWLDLGRGVRLEILGPGDPPPEAAADSVNDASIVLRLVYGKVSFLLTGDLGAAGEAALLDTPFELQATVLKLAHHGSGGSTTPAFLDAVRPVVAVASAGAGNSFGHPSPSTRLRLGGTPLLRTDLNGDVRFGTDGSRLWIRPAHGQALPADAQSRSDGR